MYAGFLHLIRTARPQLPEYVNPIFGHNTKLPLIEYFIQEQKVQLEIAEALHHSQLLIECAEAAETDAFLYLK